MGDVVPIDKRMNKSVPSAVARSIHYMAELKNEYGEGPQAMKDNLVFAMVTGVVQHSDGSFDIVDALMIAQCYVGICPSGFIYEAADVNCDGSYDIVDALLVAQCYVGLIPCCPFLLVKYCMKWGTLYKRCPIMLNKYHVDFFDGEKEVYL